jgi:hypothetical protein
MDDIPSTSKGGRSGAAFITPLIFFINPALLEMVSTFIKSIAE